MYSAFEKQPQEKKDLIIKVAIEEFVKTVMKKLQQMSLRSGREFLKESFFIILRARKTYTFI